MNRILIIFFTLIASWVSGQNEYRFDQITNESGRSLGIVYGAVQDSSGFIWIATRNGLYRYDGYSYKLFKHNRKDSTSIPYNDITYLYLDLKQNLWMRHYNRLFAFKDHKLVRTFDYVNEKAFDIDTRILQDKYHNYWIGPVKDLIIRLNEDQTLVDTFILTKKQIHPALSMWLGRNAPNYFTDSIININLEKRTTFLIASGGEGVNGNFYDFGQLYKNDELFFDANDFFVQARKDALFHLAVNVVSLDPGNYKLKFTKDESNSFGADENPMNKYGIALFQVSEESEIANLAKVDYFPDNSIHASHVKDVLINNEGYFTLLTENGIHVRKSDSWHSIPVDFRSYIGSSINREAYNVPFNQAKNGDYWVAYKNGLIKVSPHSIKNYILFERNLQVTEIKEDSRGGLWVTSTNGIYVFDVKNETLEHIEQSNKNRLYNNEVRDVLEDRSRNKWFATRGGLNRLKPFRFHYDNLQIDSTVEIFSPFPILKIGTDNYLTGGKSNKIIHFSTSSRKKDVFVLEDKIFPKDNDGEFEYDINDILIIGSRLYLAHSNRITLLSFPNTDVRNLIELNDLTVVDQKVDNFALIMLPEKNYLWVAAVDGLHKYDPDLQERIKFLSFGDTYPSVFDLDTRYVKDIDKWKGSYFIRTARNIWLFDPEKDTMESIFEFPESIQQTSLANGDCFIDTTDNSLWFSVIPEVYKYNIEEGLIDTFKIEFNEDLGDCYISKTDSIVWVATNNGLIRFNPETNDFIHYTSMDGLADNNINGVYPDIHGNIWLTSLKGLTKMNMQDERVETFFRKNDYVELSFLKTHFRHPKFEHHLILPTTLGYMTFNPDSLNPIKPPIVLSSILLFGKEAEFDSLAHEKKHLDLHYNQNFLTFELASLDYTEPSKNKFRYKMENFNDQWVYTDANNRKAPYTGLPPGEYVFVAQGTNNDGIWGDPLRLRIIIHPPWYKTITAYISYVIFIILSIVLFIRYRERKLKEEKRILEEKVKERTIEIRKQRDEIAEQKKDITDSIHYASRIQGALLPSDEFAKEVLSSYFILFKPRDIVSGDYYWLTQVDNKTIVVAADCTGHGVPGAFMSMLGVAFLNQIVVRDGTISTNEILDKLREYVIKSLKQTGEEGGSKDGMDIALTIINHDTLEAQFSGAYNPLLILRNGEIETIKADKMPIGYHIKVDSPFTSNNVKLQKGDRLYTFSDGYPDQFGGEKGRKFMSKRFKQLLIDTGDLSMEEQKEVLDKEIEAWMGDQHSQIDDILVVGVEI
jgi:ligand-binding sensor domain-containing protein/serine phosphatase RsbU (regulator of sigma subunit)